MNSQDLARDIRNRVRQISYRFARLYHRYPDDGVRRSALNEACKGKDEWHMQDECKDLAEGYVAAVESLQ